MSAVESEELLPPLGMSAAAAVQALAEALEGDGLTLGESGSVTTDRAYLDTFDGRLRAAGLAAVHTRTRGAADPGRIAVVGADEGDDERAGQELARPDAPVLAVELAPGPLREALLPVVDVRALLTLVELSVQSTTYAVRDDLEKTVARVTVEHAALSAAGGAELAPRLRLSGLRGYAQELSRVSGCARELGFTVARRRLLDDAVLAAGGTPGGTNSRVGVELLPGQRSDAAAAAILRRLLEVVEDNLEGTLADLDAEFLHDLRVAVRRSRSVQRELRVVFPPEALAHYRAEFRWLQAVTGPARDYDVYVLEWGAMRALVPEEIRGDLEPVLRVLKDRRERAHRAMERDLRSDRATRLRRDWSTFLGELVALPADERPLADQAIGALAGARIAQVYKRMVRMGSAIGPDTPAEEYHEVRKKGKELRYLLELFGAQLFPADVVKPMIKTLKAMQDTLGRHQDREVQQATLREIGEQVSAMPGRVPALMAMGVLLERLRADERAARGEFAERFAAFAARDLRQQVKATFT
jgi:CHAD domain-containing protein